MEFAGLRLDFLRQNRHESSDFVGRTAPVLGGKGVESNNGHAALAQPADHSPDVGNAFTVASMAREAALCGPASVAVHDDGNVGRRRAGLVVGARVMREAIGGGQRIV